MSGCYVDEERVYRGKKRRRPPLWRVQLQIPSPLHLGVEGLGAVIWGHGVLELVVLKGVGGGGGAGVFADKLSGVKCELTFKTLNPEPQT